MGITSSPVPHYRRHSLFSLSSIRMAKVSQIRQNYHEECEALVNKHINLELHTSYVFLSMYSYFTRDDQALPGFAAFFKTASLKEHTYVDLLMEYQTKRGVQLVFQDIAKPSKMEWETPIEAVTAVLEILKVVNQALVDLQKVATTKGDFHLVSFIGEGLLVKHVELTKFIGDLLTKMKTVGTGLGIYMVDRDLAEAYKTGYLTGTYKNFTVEEDVTKIVRKGEDGVKYLVMEKLFM